MPRKSKYNEECQKAICEAIAESGRDVDGCKAGGISYDTFYEWLKTKPEFSEAVMAARKQFKDTSLPQLRTWAKQGLKNTLQAVAEGREIITTTVVSGIAPDGSPVEMETINRQPAMVPINQAFKYVMGKDIDLITWLRQGVDLGVFPRSFVEEMIDDIDAVTERIRSKVEGRITSTDSGARGSTAIDSGVAIASALGLVDPTAVSDKMDKRSKSVKNLGKVKADRR